MTPEAIQRYHEVRRASANGVMRVAPADTAGDLYKLNERFEFRLSDGTMTDTVTPSQGRIDSLYEARKSFPELKWGMKQDRKCQHCRKKKRCRPWSRDPKTRWWVVFWVCHECYEPAKLAYKKYLRVRMRTDANTGSVDTPSGRAPMRRPIPLGKTAGEAANRLS